jgi:hypothetical protein
MQSHNPFDEFRRERRWTTMLALAVAIFLHVAVVVVLPEQILVQSDSEAGGGEETLEVELLPPEPLTPEELRFVEASPDAPENEPDRKDQYSYRAQQAADQNPNADLLEAPNVEGDENSQKILAGALNQAPPMPPGVYSPTAKAGEGEGTDGGKAGTAPAEALLAQFQPLPAPAFLQQEPVDKDGLGSGLTPPREALEVFPDADPEVPINIYRPQQPIQIAETQVGDGNGGALEAKPMPRERPRLAPELITGPLMNSRGSASRRGSVAIDATFSEFGEYEQQFYAAIQTGWYQEIEFFQPIDIATNVVVSFTIHADGTIHGTEIVRSTASEVATIICQTAITQRSPYRAWTKEMVKVFGRERTIQVVFHYR